MATLYHDSEEIVNSDTIKEMLATLSSTFSVKNFPLDWDYIIDSNQMAKWQPSYCQCYIRVKKKIGQEESESSTLAKD